MRIAELEVVNLYFEYPTRRGFRYAGGVATSRVTSLIFITADNGMTGVGATYSYPDLVKIIIEKHLRPHLLGADPLKIDQHWEKMYGLTRWYGRKGVAISALGGIDIALWDLRGKTLGKPIYKLLGAERDSVPAYASGLFWHDDLTVLEKEAAGYIDRGFRRVKMRLGHSLAYDVDAVEAVRRAVAPDNDVIIDGSHRYTIETAERLGNVLAANKVFWFEEPLPPEDIDSYVTLRRRLSIPLAAGENDFGVQGFRELLRAKALDIVQPDACRAGGITECLRIGRMAAESSVRVATHTWSDAVGLMANAHLIAALANGITVEVDQTGNPFIDQLLTEPLQIRDGLLRLPDAPGLGIEIDRAALRRFAMPANQMMPDGNYSDLTFGADYLSVPPPYEMGSIKEARIPKV